MDIGTLSYYVRSFNVQLQLSKRYLLAWLWILLTWATQAHCLPSYCTTSVSTVLAPDGTVRKGAYGSFCTTGYALTLGTGGQPIFSHRRIDSPASLDSKNTILAEGVNYYVNALACDKEGNLYVGGIFNLAGGIRVNAIAKWNGKNWSALGRGITIKGVTEATVYALALDEAGNLYAGGNFSQAGEVPTSGIAKWDGKSWSALGSGCAGTVYTLIIDKAGALYMGGSLAQVGSTGAKYLAKWDGSNWSKMDEGFNGSVAALALDDKGNLYAGGSMRHAGTESVFYIAKWDGSNWSALGKGFDNVVDALRIDKDGNLYAGGHFRKTEDRKCYVAKWDGTAWSTMGNNIKGVIYALVLDGANELYAGGSFSKGEGAAGDFLAKWDGATWQEVGSNLNSGVKALAVNKAGTLYVGGQFFRQGGAPGSFVTQWKEGKWLPLETVPPIRLTRETSKKAATTKKLGAKNK
jgi:hypothetical protein